MKKNNKGFFLVEAIVVITLVTSVLAFVYPSLSNIYDTFNNQAKYYDQTKDLYYLRALYNFKGLYHINKNIIDDMTKGCPKNESCTSAEEVVGCKSINNLSEVDETNLFLLNSSEDIKVYITDYVAEPTSSDDEFNKYLHQLKKTSWDKDSYRLIGVFQEGTNPKRYASIKIYNPNDKGFCEGKY